MWQVARKQCLAVADFFFSTVGMVIDGLFAKMTIETLLLFGEKDNFRSKKCLISIDVLNVLSNMYKVWFFPWL